MKIKAVLFDLGGTLLNFNWEHPAEIYQKILSSLGISKSFKEVKRAFLNAEKEAEDLNLFLSFGKIDQKEWDNQWGTLFWKHLGMTENAKLVRIVHSKWYDFINWTLYPEVKDILLKLQQRGLKLGLISQGYEREIHHILELIHLEKAFFNIIVGVDTVQCMKPQPEIFKYTLKELKIRSEEAIFVGDEIEADYEGAKNAGMYALLIDRTGKQKQSGLKTIGSLEDILSKVD